MKKTNGTTQSNSNTTANGGTITGRAGKGGKGPIGDGAGAVERGQPVKFSGAHDFVGGDPKSAADATTGGKDVTQENHAQISGTDPDVPQESIPEGGRYRRDAFKPDAVGTGSVGQAHRPFKLK